MPASRVYPAQANWMEFPDFLLSGYPEEDEGDPRESESYWLSLPKVSEVRSGWSSGPQDQPEARWQRRANQSLVVVPVMSYLEDDCRG